MPYICAVSDDSESFPFSAFGELSKPHRAITSNECDCKGVWISEAERSRRYDLVMNRIMGFPDDYRGPRYQGYKRG